jgi:hypothetical protein
MMAVDTSSAAGANRRDVGPAAAAWAALISEPIPSTSAATAAIICGSAIRYVIGPSFPTMVFASVERSHQAAGRLAKALNPNRSSGSGEQRAVQSVDVDRGDAGVAQVAVQ